MYVCFAPFLLCLQPSPAPTIVVLGDVDAIIDCDGFELRLVGEIFVTFATFTNDPPTAKSYFSVS